MFQISVVIPTRNRAALLGRCLASLGEQTLDPASFEVCVVDNGSTDKTAEVVELVKSHYPKHHFFRIEESQLGVAYARNAGIQHTKAPLIVQGDDDATMPPQWLERYIASFAEQDKKVAKIGGDIIPVWGAERPVWLSDGMLPLLSAASGFGSQARYVNEALLEGNACYRREALELFGNFSMTLGRKGNNLLSAEHAIDLVMNINGWKLYYDPSIIIYHYIHASRLTPVWFRRRYFWQGVSDYAVRAYLKSKGVVTTYAMRVDMPFDPHDWTFIQDSTEPPVEEKLLRLRGLGFILASSGFIPLE